MLHKDVSGLDSVRFVPTPGQNIQNWKAEDFSCLLRVSVVALRSNPRALTNSIVATFEAITRSTLPTLGLGILAITTRLLSITSLKTLLKPPLASLVICEHACAPATLAAARLSSAMLNRLYLSSRRAVSFQSQRPLVYRKKSSASKDSVVLAAGVCRKVEVRQENTRAYTSSLDNDCGRRKKRRVLIVLAVSLNAEPRRKCAQTCVLLTINCQRGRANHNYECLRV